MVRVTTLAAYADEHGNRIEYAGAATPEVAINFRGAGNRLVVADEARIGKLLIEFDCDNGLVEIGRSAGVPAFTATIRIGQDSTVRIGENVSTTSSVGMSATEGTTVEIGNDVMFASENHVLADDAHPIFDVRSGQRVNVSRSIRIGNHVWLGRRAVVVGGVTIGDGSVIGFGSVVTRSIPNNCVAAGVPARVVRRDVAWERPHLSLTRPFYKPDASTITKSAYWNTTADGEGAQTGRPAVGGAAAAARRRARRLARRIRGLLQDR